MDVITYDHSLKFFIRASLIPKPIYTGFMTKDTTHSELRAVINTIVDGVIIITDKGIIERYNPACAKIFGYTEKEAIGENVSFLMPEPYHADHDTYISNYKKTHQPKIIGIGREVRGRKKDGSVFPMYLSVGELSREDGRGFGGIIRDLSYRYEQQKKYETLQQAHFHLSRVSAMDQMGATIAHELNQPLTAVMNYTEAGIILLERQANDVSPKRLKNIMTKASEQAKRAAQILSRLRKFIETGDMDKRIQAIGPVIESAVDLTLPSFKNDGITHKIDFEGSLPDVLINDIQIQQVIVNLVRNACEAMQTVNIKHLSIKCFQSDENNFQISISDTGKGMTQAQYEKLYEPFSSTKTTGLGVGLSISRSIIANHEGRIWAEPNVPQGSIFHLTLPIS